ncbi:MAG: AAA family ATPase [Promethearchaeota archaeon]
MSSTNSKLFKYAMQEAKQAVAFDQSKKYNQARIKYTRAAEILFEFMKYNKNPNLKQLCNEKIHEYISRAKQLQGKRQRVKVGSSDFLKKEKKEPKPGITGDEDGEGDKENLSEEERELISSIEGTILMEKPNIRWEDIAGLPEPKQALRESVVLPVTHPELFRGARKPWSGILLFGPPGTGKTMLAKAAANEIKCTFMIADSASITSKWLGESEKLAKNLFAVARIKAPTLIFFDEIDSIATTRGEGNESGGIRRLKTQLLQEIQGIKGFGENLVTILAATNRPWDIDSAFLRRLQRKIYVPLPDFESRSAILKYHSRGVEGTENIDFDKLSELTEGYSGSDIEILCREAIMHPIRDLDKEGALKDDFNGKIEVRPVSIDDFTESLKKIKATVGQKELTKFNEWIKEFGG